MSAGVHGYKLIRGNGNVSSLTHVQQAVSTKTTLVTGHMLCRV